MVDFEYSTIFDRTPYILRTYSVDIRAMPWVHDFVEVDEDVKLMNHSSERNVVFSGIYRTNSISFPNLDNSFGS
jgi:hypothetical protein